jgi:hypothetical protein
MKRKKPQTAAQKAHARKVKPRIKEFRAMVTNGKMLKDLDSEIRKWLPISLAELCLAVLMVMDDIAIQNANRH